MSDRNIDAIVDRRRAISREIAKLQAEDVELETALRVYERFSPGILTVSKPEDESSPKLGPPRPEGTPSLFEMTDTVIREAIAGGKPGLRGREIVDEIGKKYWPGVRPEQILPPIYAFVSKKRLRKGENGVFKPI